jgi:adenylyltransferase/sulfurtransferase
MEQNLSADEWQRYLRQMTLPGWSLEGQARLQQCSVLVVGAGGIGSGLLPYLAGAGIGRLGIVDADIVELTNLHRQVLYTSSDLGKSKAEVAAKRLRAANPHCRIEAFPVRLEAANAVELLRDFNLIADGSDNPETRYLLNDSCVELDKTLVWGAAAGFQGQVSVFNCPDATGRRGPNLRNLFPNPDADAPDCVDAGVLGPLPGIVGAVMAAELLMLATGVGEPLVGQMLVFDARGMDWQKIRFR